MAANSVDSFVQAVKLSTDNIQPNNTLAEHVDTVELIVKNHKNAKISELQDALKKLHTERASICQLKDQIEFFRQKQKETSQQIQAIQPLSEKDLYNNKLSNLFTVTAGLEFKVNNNDSSVSMVFSKVDPNDPAREFEVTLDLEDHTKKWICVTPHIEGLLSLVQQLNTDNDLYQFARQVRSLFKHSLKDKL